MEQFILRQPAAPEETSTDRYYLDLANRLVKIAKERGLFPSYPEKVVERAALALVGYYQDVICDAGIWHAFIDENRRLYGKTLPFFDEEEGYIDAELNRADVRFMVWYALSMTYEDLRVAYPLGEEILRGADEWWKALEAVYDEAPMPVDYRLTHELEMHAEEDREALMKLGNWLFMHCYLMTPAFSLTLSEMAWRHDLSNEKGLSDFRNELEKAIGELPTGPLALYTGEWLYLIVEGKMPPVKRAKEVKPDHKYYTAFTKATGGEVVKFFGDYDSLNRFFIEGLGWAEGEEHLPQMKKERDFLVMVESERGLLVASNVARCIAAPFNDY
ncbi:MAG: DUF3843 family protein [Muribaculaceae bacterium]|nr:DUF3843 family protein [Muribaculaceae bacterium]